MFGQEAACEMCTDGDGDSGSLENPGYFCKTETSLFSLRVEICRLSCGILLCKSQILPGINLAGLTVGQLTHNTEHPCFRGIIAPETAPIPLPAGNGSTSLHAPRQEGLEGRKTPGFTNIQQHTHLFSEALRQRWGRTILHPAQSLREKRPNLPMGPRT